ncbi:hypothetical protein HY844_02740 [Candidatus Berkelbacteria bacterium]|nr:hypothetical protein [Candidatus Berkelbacteria bacterium]
MDQFFSMYNSEKVRAAVHGAGQVMNPQAPSVWGMTSDGRVRNFATEAELQAVMGSSNQVTVEHPEVSQTVESAPTPGIATRRESSEVVWKYGYVPSTTNWSDERIAKDIDSSDKPKSFEARSSYIVAGHRLYLLLRSDGGFDVEVVRDGNIIFRTKGKKSNGRYAAFFKMTPKLGDEIVVSDGQGRRSALIVVSKEEIR